ncbi:hypothetical protein HanHA300_Chr09g0299331 [Helianthus annuus]|nr:hypothetical protein HanHA300_Chr09g0299331 [Helianthus annuus]KAJ0540534.1 hypothetical protein HanHA89_Chr09g0317891 [Helianthus annuus]KAJ0705678.1 hypothetical protein HanLR1_Chr09g0298091 [Helianthus annuus]
MYQFRERLLIRNMGEDDLFIGVGTCDWSWRRSHTSCIRDRIFGSTILGDRDIFLFCRVGTIGSRVPTVSRRGSSYANPNG